TLRQVSTDSESAAQGRQDRTTWRSSRVIIPDSSRSIHQSLLGKHHQTRQSAASRSVVDLLGRSDELDLIEALLARRSRAGPGLLLRGGPGVGKTALLDAAAARAEAAGMRVLRGSGVRFEAEISFAALHQILYPLREHADRLAASHRAALHQILDPG